MKRAVQEKSSARQSMNTHMYVYIYIYTQSIRSSTRRKKTRKAYTNTNEFSIVEGFVDSVTLYLDKKGL